jgi:uncharacterized membrane protein
LKFKYTKFQITMEIVGLLLIIGMIIFVCMQWNQLPDKIPGHYNAVGEVDRWGSKGEIIALPIVAALLYLLLTTLSFLPKTWGLPVRITELNREKLYECTRSLLISIKVELIGIFFYLAYSMATSQSISTGFIPIIFFVLIGTIIYFIRQFYKIEKNKVY